MDKIYELATYLESSEYIVFYSNRPYVGITADQSRYPYSSAYYDELFNNGLGYELSKVFYEYPSFFGFHIKNNDWSKNLFIIFARAIINIKENFKVFIQIFANLFTFQLGHKINLQKLVSDLIMCNRIRT